LAEIVETKCFDERKMWLRAADPEEYWGSTLIFFFFFFF
jgi:hypothetical protein